MDRTQLLSLLPHQGTALWLDSLLQHDPRRITGLSAWHYLHKVRSDASACLLFEAAAQLCAAHGALYGDSSAIEMALVGKLSQLQLHHEPDVRDGVLHLSAEQEALSPGGALYAFAIHHQGQLLLDGKLLLVLIHA
ncbi:beta-hydroxyacyl-ACP dehydratase [Pseudomonas sp. 5P_3.1_Bac2]|uniref:beta-hydroxyacyl-ACP dehydratase n=1 Tax=Pseudomonas sp. 5P_3.1_Bac2 TaxID=2971617 RepID=UPI0021CA322C|nr:beta-hydroxyacyl-ACP dehydratase [Pseudomonas sp. 5P_3.1_Bac2]MCU1717872.1 beta-hydroxyacyl-ACP dehydratase [Pseudomonas sp. 5P_3.1_Bac2]